MEDETLIRHIEDWIASARRIAFGKLEESLMAAPENPIRTAIWGMFDRYTNTLAELICGGAEDWLGWFAWECDFGKKPMEMIFSSGKSQFVTTAAQILAAIRNDDTSI